jgi:hypothetical protein
VRIIVSWDGSGHALDALRDLVGLFRRQAVEHVEIVLTIWPAREIAMWSDIQSRQLETDDLHRAAAEIAADDARRLEDILRPIAAGIASSTTDGPFEQVIVEAISRVRADLLLVLAGTHDPSNIIRETLRAVQARAGIPMLVLRPAAEPSTPLIGA